MPLKRNDDGFFRVIPLVALRPQLIAAALGRRHRDPSVRTDSSRSGRRSAASTATTIVSAPLAERGSVAGSRTGRPDSLSPRQPKPPMCGASSRWSPHSRSGRSRAAAAGFFGRSFKKVLTELGAIFDWRGQFGYLLEEAEGNLNASG